MVVWRQVGAQGVFEFFGLLDGDQVFQLEAVELRMV